METGDAAKTLADMSSSAISARLEQVSQLFEVSMMLKSAKKVASPTGDPMAALSIPAFPKCPHYSLP